MRKFTIALLIAAACSSVVSAQNADKKWSVEAQVGKNEYRGDIYNEYFKLNRTFYGLGGIGVNRYLSKSFDLGAQFTLGRYGSKGVENTDYKFLGGKWDLSLLAKYKLNNGYLLSENSIVAPYLAIGAGYADYYHAFGGDKSKFRTGVNMLIPMGGGIKVNVSKSVALQYQLLFNFNESDWNADKKFDDKIDNFLKHSFGIVFSFGGKKKDSDKDGVADKYDACVNTPANVTVDAKGCPVDGDGDGVADYLDKCADTPAGVKVDANGCPVDSDKDGVADYMDKCSNTPASAKVDANGCPIDTDGDGVADYMDKCPNEKGVAANNGCPEVKQAVKETVSKALKDVQFETGKAALLKTSTPILDGIATLLKANPSQVVEIAGHTDNVGSDEFNQKLSEKRAEAVKKYLVSKGVKAAQLKTVAFGETKPVSDNETQEGRAKNRRVELEY